MTPEQLERAARHYCKLMGMNPDAQIDDKCQDVFAPPLWKAFTEELREQWAMNEALKEGMRDPKVDEVIGKLLGRMPDNPVDKGALNRWAEGKDVSDTTDA